MSTHHDSQPPVALVTGGSRGLGLALVTALSAQGWSVVTDARDERTLRRAVGGLPDTADVAAIVGDVADAGHRAALLGATEARGGLDLLVNNASSLGPSPLPEVRNLDPAGLRRLFETNVVAPTALLGAALPQLERRRGAAVSVSSDAGVEPYPGWGGYGASKAALDHMTAVFAREHPELDVYSFDPGDMATAMHQRAFPGEDISDRPSPASVVPAITALIANRPPSGRYTAEDPAATAAA